MKYDIQFTNQFKKDLKLAKTQNKNLDRLFEVIGILANGGTLDAKYRDHDLTGNNDNRPETLLAVVDAAAADVVDICGNPADGSSQLFLLIQADFFADGSCAVWYDKTLLSLLNEHFLLKTW